MKTEVDELARKPETEWLYYLERGEIAKKHGIETAALKKMIEATIKANEKKAREDKAEDRQRIQRVEKERSRHDGERTGDVSRRGPIKRLCVSKKKKIALSRRLSSCRAWNRRRDLLNWQSA